jgi:hypothetical protein
MRRSRNSRRSDSGRSSSGSRRARGRATDTARMKRSDRCPR